jgi:superfamily I DNA/RNA helicase
MDESWWMSPNEMTEDQQAAVQLPPDGNYLLIGPPGSGKTNILLMRAVYMNRLGVRNSRIVVFTRHLADFIRRAGTPYRYPPEQIVTYHALMDEFLRSLGVQRPDSEREKPFSKARAEMNALASDAMKSGKVGREYDLLLVDEIQDFDDSELELFQRIAQQWYFAGDDGQRVYSNAAFRGIDHIRGQATKVIELKVHYRIGLNVAALSDMLIRPESTEIRLSPGCNYDERSRPSSWQHHKCLDRSAQVEVLKRQIVVQVQSYPGEEIGVLSFRNEDVDEIRSALSSIVIGDAASEGIVSDVNRVVKVLTIHSAKGLEFRAVHIVYAETLKQAPLSRNLVRMAVTRGKSKVDIYSNGDIPKFLENAISSAASPASGDAFAELFKNEEV